MLKQKLLTRGITFYMKYIFIFITFSFYVHRIWIKGLVTRKI